MLLEKRPNPKKRVKKKVSKAIVDGENIEKDTAEDMTPYGVYDVTFDIDKKAKLGVIGSTTLWYMLP